MSLNQDMRTLFTHGVAPMKLAGTGIHNMI